MRKILMTLIMAATAFGQTTRIGVVFDGPSERNAVVLEEFRSQITAFFGGETEVRFGDKIVTGDYTSAGITAELNRLFSDRSVDVVITLGVIGSDLLSHLPVIPKPAIAAFVLDPGLQNLSVKRGTSGVKNLNYLIVPYSASRTFVVFHRVVPFKKLAVLVNEGLTGAIPSLKDRALEAAKDLGATTAIVEAGASADVVLSSIPTDADAVYVTPLFKMPSTEFGRLVDGLNQKKLPSFSYLGRAEVDRGILASYAPGDDLNRRARRVATNLQRIRAGEDAGTLPVDFSSEPRLTINMQTARAIGSYPNWNVMTEADLIHAEDLTVERRWSLRTSIEEAILANLDLSAATRSVESGEQDVRKAKSGLLPQLSANLTGTGIRKQAAEAASGQQPERQLDGGLSFSQVLYSDQAWTNYRIQSSLQSGRVSDRRKTELDIVSDAAQAYLNVLRDQALARIQRSNLQLSLSNLEMARLRETIGSANLSDVYRWESQVATSRKNVLDAEARARLGSLELNRILNRPLTESFSTEEVRLEDSSLIINQHNLLNLIDNPRSFAVFQNFMVEEGLKASPELRQLDVSIAVQERTATAASRAMWLPTFSLQGGVTNTFSTGGAGTEGLQFPPAIPIETTEKPDLNWKIQLQASLPIFTGGSQIASKRQAKIETDKAVLRRQSAERSLTGNIRQSLEMASASYASIRQAQDAATAARKNLELVKNAYAEGAVSVVTLIDAQNTDLSASESASNAVYAFLMQLMNVERAIGRFTMLDSSEERAAFLSRMEAYFAKTVK